MLPRAQIITNAIGAMSPNKNHLIRTSSFNTCFMITKFLSVYNVNCGRRGYRTLAHGHRADYGCRLLCFTDLSLPCENLRTSRLAG